MERTRRGELAAIALIVVALAVSGCGGGSDEGASSDKKVDEALEKLDEQLEKVGPLVGLGEASPPPPDAEQWETDFSQQLVPLDEFQSGGPPKDGIPAIDEPRYTRAGDVDFIDEREPVILITVGGESRAYPLTAANTRWLTCRPNKTELSSRSDVVIACLQGFRPIRQQAAESIPRTSRALRAAEGGPALHEAPPPRHDMRTCSASPAR